MSDAREEMRAAARFAAECATGDTISRALHRREIADKDATINALADALEDIRRSGFHSIDQMKAENALRLVGRIS